MSPRSRRLLAWLFVLVFVVMAWQVVVRAAGLQWAGWRQGYVRSGVIVISSSPRATVVVNGRIVGTTPKRLSALTPGLIQLQLQAPNRQSWERIIRIQPGQAVVIGPVALFPSHAVVSRGPTIGSVFVDAEYRAWNVSTTSHNLVLEEFWPDRTILTLPLATAPDRVAISPHQQVILTSTGRETAFWTSDSKTNPWVVPGLDDAWWLASSEALVFGRRDGRLYQFDTLGRTVTDLGPAEQSGPLKNVLWRATTLNSVTNVYRQSLAGSTAPHVIDTCPLTCRVTSGPDGSLIIQELNGHTRLDTFGFADQLQSIDIGVADQVYWQNASDQPLWTNGAEIWTFDSQRQPVLLDRHAYPVTQLAWVVPEHLVLIADTHAISILSVSPRQGRGVAFEAPLAGGYSVTRVASNGRSALVSGPSGPEVWRW